MAWKNLEGYRYPYRVSDQGEVQRQLKNGQWRTRKAYPYSGQWRVEMWLPDGSRKRVEVSMLVADAFMGGTPLGMRRIHKNGMMSDNAVENIVFMPPKQAAKQHRPGNSLPVLKLDRAGQVVAIYRSGSEAARANHISQAAISKRCLGLIEDPYRLDGYNYVYEDGTRKAKKGSPSRSKGKKVRKNGRVQRTV